jgi:glutamate synthase (NADPH) small chain
MYRIIRRQAFSETTFLWEVLAPDVANSAEPGHFVMLRLHEGSERIPLTVADYDREKGTVTLVVQALGKSTLEMRDHYKEGDTFADFVGPLGMPQHVDKVGHVVLVGGGLGIAPVFPQLRAFKEAGNRTTGIIGFPQQGPGVLGGDLRPLLRRPHRLHRRRQLRQTGLRHRALQEVLEQDKPDLVVAIGPLPMMRAAWRPRGPSASGPWCRSTRSWSTAPACAAPAA